MSAVLDFLLQSQEDTAGSSASDAVVDSVRWSLTTLQAWIEGLTGFGVETQGKVFTSLVAVIGVYVLRKIVLRVVDRKVDDSRLLYQWSKGSSQVAFVLAFLLVATIWLEAIQSLGTFLGLLSAGIAIALKDLVASLAGWVFIMWRRPFQLGDRIQIGDITGDVVDIRIFQFTLLEIGNWVHADQSTGRIIHVPNARLLTEPLANYTAQFQFIWNELPILVTFESDWRKAKTILQEILEEKVGGVVAAAEKAVKMASKKFLIHFTKLTPKVYTSVEESGVLLTLRFICDARKRRGTAEEVWECVLDAFGQEPDIDFAYPTTRMYHNLLEGKRGARAPLPPGWGGVDAPGKGE
ncbi:MAG: mechanosensitive ion channel family protein [Longimicrobiales bacterium]